jgi:hypothetical protein
MIRDFLQRKDIDASAKKIVDAAVKGYPPSLNRNGSYKKSQKKIDKKFQKTLSRLDDLVAEERARLRLGVYGKARLYKSVQSELFAAGYEEDAALYLLGRLVGI